jgi:hypothetical protein
MPLRKLGVLAGKPIGHLRDADDDHYQILVKADNMLFHRGQREVIGSEGTLDPPLPDQDPTSGSLTAPLRIRRQP